MRKVIALDANLLVLLVVGLTDHSLITSHKRLKEYTPADFKLLERLISASSGVVVTPNVLSEASNLLRQISEPAKSRIGQAFRKLIHRTDEIYVVSSEASYRSEFLRLGLTDCSLLELSKQNIIIVSADLGLYLAAQNLFE